MDGLVIAGVLTMGLAVGLLVGWFVNEDQPFTATGLTTSISVLSGAGVLGFFQYLSPSGPTQEIWFYPLGILLGILIAPFLDVFYNALYDGAESDDDVRAIIRKAEAAHRAIVRFASSMAVKQKSGRNNK